MLGRTIESLEAPENGLHPPALGETSFAVDAPPASYLMNIGAADEADIDDAQVLGVVAAVAPIVGTARVASAGGNIARALGLVMELAEESETES